MAGSKRIRNLIEPLIRNKLINVRNLIFQSESNNLSERQGKTDNIQFKVIGVSLRNIFSVFGFYYRGFVFIKESKNSSQKNIIYNYGGPNIQNILFLLYSKVIGFKIVCDIVEDNRFEPSVNILNWLKTRSSVSLLKLSKYYADSFIGISDHLYNRLIKISKGKVPVHLIPISVNLNNFIRRYHKSTRSEFKIFYGGSFNEKDGLGFLMDAFSEVSKIHADVKLVITGLGNKPDMERILSLIDKSENGDRIEFKGFLSNNDYFTLLNECDIFCMTRIDSNHANTGFPFKLGEFLASGKAVIATNVGDIPKYLTNNINAVLIEPSSVPLLTGALLLLIENPEKIEQIGKEGRKTAECYFDSDKLSLMLFTIFQSV
jgi:glycosyltransferase involved in cell wall biosynthesis